MEDFLKEIKNNFNNEQCKIIENTLNILKDNLQEDKVYNIEFAEKLGLSIMENKLGFHSVVAGLYFPFIKLGIEIPNKNKQGEETQFLISSLENLETLNLETKEEQLEGVKKMFISIAKEMRVVIIKLLIEALKLDYIDKFSQEDLEKMMKVITDIYSPIASMLGMSQIKNKFENATFKYYKPKMYEELSKVLSEYFEERNQSIKDVIDKIRKEIQIISPHNLVYGRQKQMASIAKKLQSKDMSVNSLLDVYGRDKSAIKNVENIKFSEFTFNHIVDILAVRVIVDTIDECYAVLGKIFSMFKPFGDCKDYISHPKENGYQSIHTAIVLDNGDPVEVQIRTFDMHNYAEYGLASHWAYKFNKKVDANDAKINYFRSIMDLYKEKSSDELLEVLKTDVYVGRIFVQTPQGKILEFPEGSTPIDFAYGVHSQVGDTCVGAKINGKMATLSTLLKNGDVVEIITSPLSKGPSRDWLKICKTAGAKSKINSFFKKSMKEDNIKKGKSMFDAYCKAKNVPVSKVWQESYLNEVLERYSFTSIDDMLASIGYGGITSNQIFNKLYKLYKDDLEEEQGLKGVMPGAIKEHNHSDQVSVRGYSNMLVKFAKCCNPLPGDEITGYVSRGKGVTIHRADCASLKLCEFDRLIECSWNESNGKGFIGDFSVIAQNKSTTLSQISKRISDSKLNIISISSRVNNQNQFIVTIRLEISSKVELNEIMSKIENLSCVYEVYRNV